jgi:hypothetical protein
VGISVTLLLILGLACWRLTRLVTADDFPLIAKPREWVIGEDGTAHEGRWYHWFGELISCYWCASGWISLGLTGLAASTALARPWQGWLVIWWAVWAVSCLISNRIEVR